MIRAAALCTVMTLITFEASAYSIKKTDGGHTIRWDKMPVTYYLNPKGSDNIGDGSDIAAVKSAFDQWQAIGCSKLAFQNLGNTNLTKVTSIGGGAPNAKNEVVWVEGSDWTLGKYVLAVTIPVVYWDGRFSETDIAFNGLQVKWSTSGKFGMGDVKSVAAHEIGHMIGLMHVLGNIPPGNPPTMAPKADPYGKTATLEADDKKGACFLYPTGDKFICNGQPDCPYIVEKDPDTGEEWYDGQLICKGSVCQYVSTGTPKKTFGELCEGDGECQLPYFCQPVTATESYCSFNCDPQKANDCPPGYACYPYEGGTEGACIAKNVSNGLPNGSKCEHNLDCQSSNCYPVVTGQWECWPVCETDAQCIGSNKCFHAPGFVDGVCLPKSKLPSFKLQNGDPCNAAEECESGICIVNPGTGGPQFCRTSCTVGVDACSIGFECVPISQGGGACVPQPENVLPGEVWETCEAATDCKSQMCMNGVCRQPCALGTSACQPPDQAGCLRTQSDTVVGYCYTRGALDVMQPCTSDAGCNSLFCVPDANGVRTCQSPCLMPEGTGCPLPTDICHKGSGLTKLGICFPKPATPGSTTGSANGTATGQTNDTGSDGWFGADTGDGSADQDATLPPATVQPESSSSCQFSRGIGQTSPLAPALTLLLILLALWSRRESA